MQDYSEGPAYALVDPETRYIKMNGETGVLAIFDTAEAASAHALGDVIVVPVYIRTAE